MNNYRKNLINDIEECYLFRKESRESWGIMRGINLQECSIRKLISIRYKLYALPDINALSLV